jgi:plastocyanin domain-containing protein
MHAAHPMTPWWKRWFGPPRPVIAADGPQVRVVRWGAGASAGLVTVKAGLPITLVFERLDGSAAGESVTIPALGWVSTLGHAAHASVELAPCVAGAYEFRSLDGVLRGCLVVEP